MAEFGQSCRHVTHPQDLVGRVFDDVEGQFEALVHPRLSGDREWGRRGTRRKSGEYG
jgi:hypothetical protein